MATPAMIWDRAWIWRELSDLKAPLGLKKYFSNPTGGSSVNVKPQRATEKYSVLSKQSC
jgi:hypothetical protein